MFKLPAEFIHELPRALDEQLHGTLVTFGHAVTLRRMSGRDGYATPATPSTSVLSLQYRNTALVQRLPPINPRVSEVAPTLNPFSSLHCF